jgi:hypothetical protein
MGVISSPTKVGGITVVAEYSNDRQACTCSEWVENAAELESLLAGRGHEPIYQSAPIRFCPWCGKRLGMPTEQRDEELLQRCCQRVEEAFFSDDEWGVPQYPNMLVAARPISDYREQTMDVLGTLELMLAFVEAGTRHTQKYGDMDEPFYEGLELMLGDFADLLLAHPHLYEEANLARRVAQLAKDASWVGWGYGDFVREQVGRIQQHFGDV